MNKNNSLFIILMCTFTFTSCYKAMFGTLYSYEFALTKSTSTTDMKFSDEKIDVNFLIGDQSINFNIKNKTNEPIKILWDEASLNLNGELKKIIHQGITYLNRNNYQQPTVVQASTSFDDLVMPFDNFYYEPSIYISNAGSSAGSWRVKDLFYYLDYNKPAIKDLILKNKGQKLTLYLPIYHLDKKLDYTFEFIITDIKPSLKK